MKKVCVHFVGFRGEEYHSAVAVWGKPDFVHRYWDVRAVADVSEDDFVVFARQEDFDNQNNPKKQSFDDSAFF